MKQVEWNEEDKTRIDGVIQWLRDHQKTIDRRSNNQAYESIESLIFWLKSLPSRIALSNWKPSSQQIAALDIAIAIVCKQEKFPLTEKYLTELSQMFK